MWLVQVTSWILWHIVTSCDRHIRPPHAPPLKSWEFWIASWTWSCFKAYACCKKWVMRSPNSWHSSAPEPSSAIQCPGPILSGCSLALPRSALALSIWLYFRKRPRFANRKRRSSLLRFSRAARLVTVPDVQLRIGPGQRIQFFGKRNENTDVLLCVVVCCPCAGGDDRKLILALALVSLQEIRSTGVQRRDMFLPCLYLFHIRRPSPLPLQGGGARDSEASAAPCSPSLTGRSAALRRHDLSRNAMPFRCGKTDVFEPFGGLWTVSYRRFKASKWATSWSFEKPSVLHCHAVKAWRRVLFPELGAALGILIDLSIYLSIYYLI